MKTTKIFFLALTAVFALSSCSSAWLDHNMTGASLTQEEFDHLTGTGEATVRGLYANFYAIGGSEHHYFGQKSIDMATDLISSDMAMTANAYGWFVDCAQLNACYQTSGRNSYIWSYYYSIIMNANKTIVALQKRGIENLSVQDKNYLAQALTVRAYCYYNIVTLYTPGANDDTPDRFLGQSGMDFLTAPLYLEKDTVTQEDAEKFGLVPGLPKEQAPATKLQLHSAVDDDLTYAVSLFQEDVNGEAIRESKLFVDVNVALAIKAYNYLQMGENEKAYQIADSVINTAPYSILRLDEVKTSGFNSVESNSWMWGLDVTADNTGGLASFWGHMDIHTYSYAYAGATKAIDADLYKRIPETDKRREWFDANNKYVNDYKFFDSQRGEKADEIDRRWLNDVVFMRIEEMYLVGAEAAYRAGDEANSKRLLKILLQQRDETAADGIDAWNGAKLYDEIYYNWRVEMWGEGRALNVMKRFAISKNRGNNHFQYSGEAMEASDPRVTFALPYAESSTNNKILELVNNKAQ